jgi:hypothetical protein
VFDGRPGHSIAFTSPTKQACGNEPKVLHHSAVALHELHYSKITHEEVKPSHVLVLPEGDAKLGGFARARDQERPKPAADAGRDPVWAPPEVLYGRQVRVI